MRGRRWNGRRRANRNGEQRPITATSEKPYRVWTGAGLRPCSVPTCRGIKINCSSAWSTQSPASAFLRRGAQAGSSDRSTARRGHGVRKRISEPSQSKRHHGDRGRNRHPPPAGRSPPAHRRDDGLSDGTPDGQVDIRGSSAGGESCSRGGGARHLSSRDLVPLWWRRDRLRQCSVVQGTTRGNRNGPCVVGLYG